MSAIEKRIQDLARLAFVKIVELAKSTEAKDAARVLGVIEKIALAVQAGFARKISPDDLAKMIERESKALVDMRAANRKTILSEIDKKFPV